MEELIVEMLEDYYERHPAEIDRFFESIERDRIEWDGKVSEQYEKEMKSRWDKIHGKKGYVDLSQFQSDEKLTPEQEKEILEKLGTSLPKSTKVTKKTQTYVLGEGQSDDEFDETF